MEAPGDHQDALDAATRRACEELAEEACNALSDHPSVEDLVAYQESRLNEAGAERVRRHLAICPGCAEEFLQLGHFDPDLQTDQDLLPSREETAADWQRFQHSRGRTDRQPGLASGGRPSGEVPRRSRLFPTRLSPSLALVASIALAITGLAFWAAGLARWRASSTVPGVAGARAPFVFDLLPDEEDLRRDASLLQEIDVPPGTDFLVPRLLLGDQTPHPKYRADVLSADGQRVWSQAEVPRQPNGSFALLVDWKALQAGRYRLRLFGRTAEGEVPLATYSLRLREARGE